MLEEIKKNHNLIKILIILLIAAVGSYVFSLAWGVVSKFLDLFVILLSAWLLMFILEPVVEKIQNLLKTSKLISTIIIYTLISILLVIICIVYVPLVTSQVTTIANIIPYYLKSAPSLVIAFNQSLVGQISNSVVIIPTVAQFLFYAFIN